MLLRGVAVYNIVSFCQTGFAFRALGPSLGLVARVRASGSSLLVFGSKEARRTPGLLYFRGFFMRGCLYEATVLEFGWLAVYVPVQEGRRPWGLRVSLFAHHAVSVRVPHVLIGRVAAVKRRYAGCRGWPLGRGIRSSFPRFSFAS